MNNTNLHLHVGTLDEPAWRRWTKRTPRVWLFGVDSDGNTVRLACFRKNGHEPLLAWLEKTILRVREGVLR